MAWRDYHHNIKVRLITSFLNRVVTSAVMPFMALFFANQVNKVWAGILLILSVIIGFFANLIGGYVSDRFSRKKVLMFTSSSSSFMFFVMTICLFSVNKQIWLFAFAYIGFIITSSLGRPSMNAIIIDSTTAENRKSVYAFDYWLINLSMAIGTTLGGLFYVRHQIELFIVLTITSLIIPIIYGFWLQVGFNLVLQKKHKNIFFDLINNYRTALKDLAFVKVVVGSTFIFAAEFTLNSYIGVRLAESFKSINVENFEFTGVQMLSLLNVQNMIIVVCLTFLINRFTDKLNKKRAFIIGIVFYGVGYVTITSANIWYILILFNLFATIGEIIYSPIRDAEQANMIPDDKRGSYSAFSNLSFSGAELIARSTIILGAFIIPTMMSVYIGIIIMIGTFFVYNGLFLNKKTMKKSDAITT